MMRYLVTVNMREDIGAAPAELVEAMGRGMAQMFASGAMVDSGQLLPTSSSTQIRVRGGNVLVSDGPYAEAKEVAGGYSIVSASSNGEAVELARQVAELHRQFWPGWEGSVEVRPIADHTGPA